MTRLVGVSLTMTSNHLYKHGTLKMGVALRKAIYAKMMQQDMAALRSKTAEQHISSEHLVVLRGTLDACQKAAL